MGCSCGVSCICGDASRSKFYAETAWDSIGNCKYFSRICSASYIRKKYVSKVTVEKKKQGGIRMLEQIFTTTFFHCIFGGGSSNWQFRLFMQL